jgi:steroid delta-isomerase-like uncharacterized protein
VGDPDNREIYRRMIEAINRNEPRALDDLMWPDIVDHYPFPGQAPGLDGIKQWMSGVRDAFPDLDASIEDVVAEDDRVAARVTWRGTHRGEFVGIPPTGKPVAFPSFHLVRFSEGRAVEWWGLPDLLGALRQLGATVVPSGA